MTARSAQPVDSSESIRQPSFYCPICKKTVKFHHKDDALQNWVICENGHQTAEGCLIKQPMNPIVNSGDQPLVLEHINNIENPDLIGKSVIIEAVISSTSTSYVVPSKVKAVLTEKDQESAVISPEISIKDPINIGLVAVTEETKNGRLNKFLKQRYPDAKIFVKQELKHRTVYMVRVRPPVFTLEKCGDKVVDEKGYEYKFLELYVASDTPLTFQPSTLMRITGFPLPHPRTQTTTMLSYVIEFPEDDLNFKLEKLNELKAKFDGKNVTERLQWILENFELYSHIFGRHNIATAALLGFFSPLYVNFNGEIQRGWSIEAIIGDTTTGKSETVKKLSKRLKAGSIISAETASAVGLTGTTFQVEKTGWGIDWGFLPLMDRKLLAIDGAHKLSASCWAALAEAERSGVLSIAKAAKNTTYARTRQIRIYNAVDKEIEGYGTKSLGSFLYPIQALTTVLDPTSIARLDLAVFSDQRDVTPEEVNRKIIKDPDPALENLSEVLKWTWGKTAKVEWTETAVTTLLEQSTELYKKFFNEAIPLVSIDTKWKIARLAVSLAYFTLSTNENYTIVQVTAEHIKAIVNFITEEYRKAGLGILSQEQRFEKLTNEDVIALISRIQAQLCKNPINSLTDILRFIVTQNHTTNEELKLKFSLAENNQARPLIATLKTEGLLNSKRGYYPTPKLIEAYKITEGFTKLPIFNGDNGFNVSKKEPLTPILSDFNRDKNENLKINLENTEIQVQISEGGFNSETVKTVIPVKNQETEQLKVVTEDSGLRHLETRPIFSAKETQTSESEVSKNYRCCGDCGRFHLASCQFPNGAFESVPADWYANEFRCWIPKQPEMSNFEEKCEEHL